MAWEKMSKSRGNVISVDDVVYGVYRVAPGYEFRDLHGLVINPIQRVRQDGPDYRYRYMDHLGGAPVFLHLKGEPVPPLIRGKRQHPECVKYWRELLEKHEARCAESTSK